MHVCLTLNSITQLKHILKPTIFKSIEAKEVTASYGGNIEGLVGFLLTQFLHPLTRELLKPTIASYVEMVAVHCALNGGAPRVSWCVDASLNPVSSLSCLGAEDICMALIARAVEHYETHTVNRDFADFQRRVQERKLPCSNEANEPNNSSYKHLDGLKSFQDVLDKCHITVVFEILGKFAKKVAAKSDKHAKTLENLLQLSSLCAPFYVCCGLQLSQDLITHSHCRSGRQTADASGLRYLNNLINKLRVKNWEDPGLQVLEFP